MPMSVSGFGSDLTLKSFSLSFPLDYNKNGRLSGFYFKQKNRHLVLIFFPGFLGVQLKRHSGPLNFKIGIPKMQY